MIKNVKGFLKPKSVDELLQIISNENAQYKLLAGGTSLNLSSDLNDSVILDLNNVGLNHIIDETDKIIIGATVKISELIESEVIKKFCNGIIFKGCEFLASTPLRNLISVGGNIIQLYPWSDLPLVFLLLDAKVKVCSYKNSRIIAISDLLKSHPTKSLQNNEIVTEFIFDKYFHYTGNFKKFSKTTFDYSLVNTAVVMKIVDGVFNDVKFGISACGPLPQVLVQTSNLICGENVNNTNDIENILNNSLNEIKIIKDKRVSVDYKKSIIPVLLKRLMNNIM